MVASPAIAKQSAFRKELEDVVMTRHCAHHPMTEKWKKGELSRNALKGWAVEHFHWTSNILGMFFDIAANAPKDVVRQQVENWLEEADEKHPHTEIVLKFAKANGADIAEVKKGRGLPTTESWVRFLRASAKQPSWIAGVAALNIGTESQSPLLYGSVLPALREKYKFKEDEIQHFWLHTEADVEHGGRAFDVLEEHCTTRELKDLALHWAYESARMRWLYFDGIFLHYDMNYPLV